MAHPFVPRALQPGLDPLNDLALDLRWTWSHAGDRLWQALDRQAWEVTNNPWLILQSVSHARLQDLAKDAHFREEMEAAADERLHYLKAPGWYGETFPAKPLKTVAYFSMEFGLGGALALYAGGLGVLAGDYLKTASDLGVPMVGVGLLYQEGYFRQILDAEGRQIEAYPYNDPLSLPIFPVRDAQGDWLRIPLELPGRVVTLRLWHAHVGRVNLFLLDSNDPLNSPADRGITSRLYDDQRDRRLLQELALGIGGWRALEAVRLEIDVCHLNEGHTAFLVLERARAFARKTGLSFEEAWWATRAGNVFTTHTPVLAAFDRFAPDLVVRYFRDYAEQLDISVGDLLALGRFDPRNSQEPFTTTLFAARGSIVLNGVSRLHGEVSRALAQPIFPRWPRGEVPVGHITNGVHMPSWDSESADNLWTCACGKNRWLGTLESLCPAIEGTGDIDLWSIRSKGRHALVTYARHRLARQFGHHGADPVQIDRARRVLDPNALTLGVARRFTAYKRPNLLLHDPARFERMLRDSRRPVQLVVAGKAHPQDQEGKELVHELTEFARRPEVRDHVVFLEDYDIPLATYLTQGVDVWVNTPRRPWEACGTSGMKALVNGGINVSELDGWWAEAYEPGVGWALGDGREHNADPAWDAFEAEQLYRILEAEIIPEFYDRDPEGLPRAWIARIRRSMARLAPQFSSNRMMRQYVEEAYFPAASAFRQRSAEGGKLASALHAWANTVARYWAGMHFGDLRVEQDSDGSHRFSVQLYLGEMPLEFVAVELYAEAANGRAAALVPMQRLGPIAGAINGHLYAAAVPATRPAADYTPRVIPYHPDARVPLESRHILWER